MMSSIACVSILRAVPLPASPLVPGFEITNFVDPPSACHLLDESRAGWSGVKVR